MRAQLNRSIILIIVFNEKQSSECNSISEPERKWTKKIHSNHLWDLAIWTWRFYSEIASEKLKSYRIANLRWLLSLTLTLWSLGIATSMRRYSLAFCQRQWCLYWTQGCDLFRCWHPKRSELGRLRSHSLACSGSITCRLQLHTFYIIIIFYFLWCTFRSRSRSES